MGRDGQLHFCLPHLRLPAPAVGAAISASSHSLRASARGAAAWYETSEVQQQAALQPKERKGLRENTRGADAAQRVLVVLRAEAPGAAGRST